MSPIEVTLIALACVFYVTMFLKYRDHYLLIPELWNAQKWVSKLGHIVVSLLSCWIYDLGLGSPLAGYMSFTVYNGLSQLDMELSEWIQKGTAKNQWTKLWTGLKVFGNTRLWEEALDILINGIGYLAYACTKQVLS